MTYTASCYGRAFVASAVSVTSSGALEGRGKEQASLVISLPRYVLIIILAAFLPGRAAGAEGVQDLYRKSNQTKKNFFHAADRIAEKALFVCTAR